MPIEIPLSPADVTPEWLADVLRLAGLQAVEVRAVTATPAASLTSTMHRLDIEYAISPVARDDLPRTLFWKQTTVRPEARAAFGRSEDSGYEREVTFYQDIAPSLPLLLPSCFLARYDAASGEHVLLIEDLSATHRSPADSGLTPEDAAAVVRELALLHASRWNALPSTPPRFSADASRRHFEDSFASNRRYLRSVLDDATFAALEAVVRHYPAWTERLERGPQTLIHADVHPGNILLPEEPGGRAVLIDWQGWRVGSPMTDLAKCLVLGLSTEERGRAEGALLAEYASVLRAEGVAYPGDPLEDYRAAAGLRWVWAVTFPNLAAVWDDALRALMPLLIQRAAAAALDAIGATFEGASDAS